MQGIQDINDVYGNLACVTDCTRFAVPACFHPGAVCVKAIDGTISQSGLMKWKKSRTSISFAVVTSVLRRDLRFAVVPHAFKMQSKTRSR